MRLLQYAILTLFVSVLILGCSGADSPVSPEKNELTGNSGLNLGYFIINYDEANHTLVVEPDFEFARKAEIDVTKFAQFGIDALHWDEGTRNWTLDCWVSNPTSLTGYGIWIVFSEMGEKKLVGHDGFIWILKGDDMIVRVPFQAIRKGSPLRVFPPLIKEYFEVVIHWPEGVDKWVPIQFYIDASWPEERQTPMVENLSAWQSIDSATSWITAWVADFQDSGDTLDVYADLTPLGMGPYHKMFDDGLHGDGMAGDSIFGVDFFPTCPSGDYTITIYAVDPWDNWMENDVYFTFTEMEQPEITVVTPNGGEMWQIGSDEYIQWKWTGNIPYVNIYYSKDDFVADVNTIASDVANTGEYLWENIPADPSNTVKVRIAWSANESVFDDSDDYFSIMSEVPPMLQLLIPNGGEIWEVGSTQEITWESHNLPGPVNLLYSKDSFNSDFHLIEVEFPNTGSYFWEGIPDDPSTTVKVRVISVDDPSYMDDSDDFFTIFKPPWIEVIVPNGGENWQVGSNHAILWDSGDVPGTVFIEYSKDDFVSDIHTIASDEPNDGNFMWYDIPNDLSNTVKVRISSTDDPGISDESDDYFTISTSGDPCRDFVKLRDGQHCHVDWETTYAIRSQQEWDLYKNIVWPWPNPPEINWETEMVVAMFMGDFSHSGYYPVLNDICLDDENVLHVNWTKWAPGDGCLYLWVFTQPYLIVKCETYAGEIVFDTDWKVYKCD